MTIVRRIASHRQRSVAACRRFLADQRDAHEYGADRIVTTSSWLGGNDITPTLIG